MPPAEAVHPSSDLGVQERWQGAGYARAPARTLISAVMIPLGVSVALVDWNATSPWWNEPVDGSTVPFGASPWR